MSENIDTTKPVAGDQTPAPALSFLDLDKPETWASPEIYAYPDFDHHGFQKQLDEIFGLTEGGLSKVRLVWPGDIKKCYSKFYTSWTNAGFGVDTELRAKYRYASVQIPGTPDVIDIPPPRWIIEEYNHPGQYLESWEAARFDKEGREIRPAPPPSGYYSHLWTIALHRGECCKEAKKNMKVCWGAYRRPDQSDLEVLKKARFKRDQDPEIDTTKPLDEAALAAVAAEVAEKVSARREAAMKELKEFVDENAIELLEAFTGIKASDVARKRFSIPAGLKGKNKTTTESGIIVPYK